MSNTYRNPILPGFNPDPSLCHVPGVGFFASTSTFEFFPGLPIYHSTDAVNWKVSTVDYMVLARADGSSLDMPSTDGVRGSSFARWRPRVGFGLPRSDTSTSVGI